MAIVSPIVLDGFSGEEPDPTEMGDLGKFRVKRLGRAVGKLGGKAIGMAMKVAQPAMKLTGGVAPALGPVGWASTGLTVASSLAARHQAKRRQRMAPPPPMPEPAPDSVMAPAPEPAYMPPPEVYQPPEPQPEMEVPPMEMPSVDMDTSDQPPAEEGF